MECSRFQIIQPVLHACTAATEVTEVLGLFVRTQVIIPYFSCKWRSNRFDPNFLHNIYAPSTGESQHPVPVIDERWGNSQALRRKKGKERYGKRTKVQFVLGSVCDEQVYISVFCFVFLCVNRSQCWSSRGEKMTVVAFCMLLTWPWYDCVTLCLCHPIVWMM